MNKAIEIAHKDAVTRLRKLEWWHPEHVHAAVAAEFVQSSKLFFRWYFFLDAKNS